MCHRPFRRRRSHCKAYCSVLLIATYTATATPDKVQTAASGVPVWAAVAIPIAAALLGLLGGGIVRFVLDRRQAMMRATGYARVVREELYNVLERLDPNLEGVPALPTDAWSQYATELAGALTPDEFSALTRVYRTIAANNWQLSAAIAPISGAPPIAIPITPEIRGERHMVALVVEHIGLPSIEWLATGRVPWLRQRRAIPTMTPVPETRCRCGHQWVNHRWTWQRRRWWRLRWRFYTRRSVAHECNVVGCVCTWFRTPGQVHLPRAIQRFGPGRQAPHVDLKPKIDRVDSSIPSTAQPGAVVSPEDDERDAANDAE
jgi:hypothetical protein